MRQFARARSVAMGGALVLAALGVAGCSEDRKDGSASSTPTATTESESPSASQSPSPSASVPTPPPLARQRDSEGAIAFVQFYIELVNEGNKTGQPDLVAPFSEKECVACGRIRDGITKRKAKGQVTEGTLYSVSELGMLNLASADKVLLSGQLTTGPTSLVDAQGKVVEDVPMTKGPRDFAIKWVNNAWQMFDMEESA